MKSGQFINYNVEHQCMICVTIVETYLLFHLLLLMPCITTLHVEVTVFTFLMLNHDKRKFMYNCIIQWNNCLPEFCTLTRHAFVCNCKKFMSHIDYFMILQSVKMIVYYL